MKSLTSWLLAFFMIMFWAFRVMVALFAQTGRDLGGFIVFDNTIEMILLFLSVLIFILVIRRSIIGASMYLVSYGFYFGKYIIETALPAFSSGESNLAVTQNALLAILGIMLALFVFLNIAFEKNVKRHYSDNKTDWFFDNKEYDRKLDDRADTNQYKF